MLCAMTMNYGGRHNEFLIREETKTYFASTVSVGWQMHHWNENLNVKIDLRMKLV